MGSKASTAADLADRLLLPALLAAAVLGAVLPGPGRAAGRGGAILATLAVLVLAAGTSLTPAGLRAAAAGYRRLLVVLAVTTPALPALAWLASRLVAAAELRGSVLAAGVAPAEVASVALAALAGGEEAQADGGAALAAGLLAGSTAATVLLAGPVLALLGARPAGSPAGLLVTLALVVALPLLAGAALRAAAAGWFAGPGPGGGEAAGTPAARLVSAACLLLLIWEIASQLRPQRAELTAAAALLGFGAACALLGALLARGAPQAWRPAVMLPVAMRDFAVAAGIAASAFGPAAAAPLGAYGVAVLAGGAGYVQAARRRARRAA